MMWLLTALASSGLTASNAEMNRRHQQEGFRLNLWRTLLMSVFWAPLALLLPWPAWSNHGWAFYAAALFGGVGMIVGNMVQADLSARHNGRVAILYMPLKAMLVYVLWLGLHADTRAHLLDAPWRAPAVLLCFGAMVLAMNAMRRNDASVQALKAVLPVVVMYGISDLLTRSVLPAAQLHAWLIIYLFVMNVSSTVVSGVFWLSWPARRPRPELPLYTPKLLRAAGWVALSGALNNVCFTIALTSAPNPAYASMITLLAPVWLLGWHRLKGVRDDASPWAGMLLVAAALVLMVVTR